MIADYDILDRDGSSLKQANKLSKDRPARRVSSGDFIIYANGTRWYIETWVTHSLYWVPFSMCESDEISEVFKYKSELKPEFQCTWLPPRKMIKLMKRIIFTHPNLSKNLYWSIVDIVGAIFGI